MFLALSLKRPEYTSAACRASSNRPTSDTVARLSAAACMFFWCAKAPQHRQLGLLHGQRVLVVFHRKPFPSCSSRSRAQFSLVGPRHVFQHAHRARARRRGTVARTGCTRTTDATLSQHLGQIVLLASTKFPPAPPGTTACAKPAVPATRTHRARGPPSFSSGGPGVQMRTSGPWCPRRTPRPRRLRPPRASYLRCTAQRRLPFLSVCRAVMAASSNAAPGIQAHSSACCSGRISCPRKAKVGGADGTS